MRRLAVLQLEQAVKDGGILGWALVLKELLASWVGS